MAVPRINIGVVRSIVLLIGELSVLLMVVWSWYWESLYQWYSESSSEG